MSSDGITQSPPRESEEKSSSFPLKLADTAKMLQDVLSQRWDLESTPFLTAVPGQIADDLSVSSEDLEFDSLKQCVPGESEEKQEEDKKQAEILNRVIERIKQVCLLFFTLFSCSLPFFSLVLFLSPFSTFHFPHSCRKNKSKINFLKSLEMI